MLYSTQTTAYPTIDTQFISNPLEQQLFCSVLVLPMEVLMKTDYSYLLEEYPETISMNQLYKICHISKRKAKWLLDHGVIPCKDSGKKTRRFTIKTVDLTQYLQKLNAGKIKDTPPPGIFSSHSPNSKINYKKINISAFTAFLNKQWVFEPDALTVEKVSTLLGYNKSTVTNWIKIGRLKAVPYRRSYLIPKEWLIRYLAETVNDGRASKSEKHMKLIRKCQKN